MDFLLSSLRPLVLLWLSSLPWLPLLELLQPFPHPWVSLLLFPQLEPLLLGLLLQLGPLLLEPLLLVLPQLVLLQLAPLELVLQLFQQHLRLFQVIQHLLELR